MPSLAELCERFRGDDNVQFVFLQIGEPLETSVGFVAREGFDVPVFDSIIAHERKQRRVLSASGDEVKLPDIGIRSCPTTIFLDKNGVVMGRISSNYHWQSWGDSMADAVRDALPRID